MNETRDTERDACNDRPSTRVARLAWFELADAATRRAVAAELWSQRRGRTDR